MCEREMYYKRITSTNDADIPYLTFILKSPEISRYISIAENSYWEYVTTQEQVYYFKVYRNDALIGAIHCEIENLILYMDIMVFPKYQRQGIATAIMEDILQGTWKAITVSELRASPFDEKLSVMGLVLARLTEEAKRLRMQDELTAALHASLKAFKAALPMQPPRQALEELIALRQSAMKVAKDAGHLEPDVRTIRARELNALQEYRSRLVEEDIPDEAAFEAVKGWFGGEVERRRELAAQTSCMFDNAFRFLEETFAQGQELVMFVTEVTAGYDTSWFVETFGCDAYFRHNRELLFDETQRRIRDHIAAARGNKPEEPVQ